MNGTNPMRPARTFLAAACALAALAGCGAPNPPAAAVATGAAPSTFDGVYQGSVRITAVSDGSTSAWCQTAGAVTIPVSGGRFPLALPHPNVPGTPTIRFQADIVPGGSFQNQSEDGTAMLTGQVGGGRLQGVVNGAGCQYAISASRT